MSLLSFAVVIALCFLTVLALVVVRNLLAQDGSSDYRAKMIERRFTKWAESQGMKT